MELSPIHVDAQRDQKWVVADVVMPSFNQLTESTLVENLLCDPTLAFFLRTSGILYPNTRDSYTIVTLQSCWTTVMRFFVVYMFGLGTYFFCAHLAQRTSDNFNLTLACMGLALASQALILLPSIPKMVTRFQSPVLVSDLPHFTKAVFLCRTVFLVSIALGVVVTFETYCGYGATRDGLQCSTSIAVTATLAAFQGLGHIAISSILAVNCMFVLTDCFASMSMVEDLIRLHSENALTIERFNFCRADIKHRVDSNYWTYNATMLVAMMDVLLIVVLIFIDNVLPIMCVAFVKEIPFILAALFYSMTVNEKSDQLTKILGKKMNNQLLFSQIHTITIYYVCTLKGTTMWSKEDLEANHQRLFFYSNASAQRISFPLAGMRLTRRDLWVRLGASVLAFVIGFTRNAIASLA